MPLMTGDNKSREATFRACSSGMLFNPTPFVGVEKGESAKARCSAHACAFHMCESVPFDTHKLRLTKLVPDFKVTGRQALRIPVNRYDAGV